MFVPFTSTLCEVFGRMSVSAVTLQFAGPYICILISEILSGGKAWLLLIFHFFMMIQGGKCVQHELCRETCIKMCEEAQQGTERWWGKAVVHNLSAISLFLLFTYIVYLFIHLFIYFSSSGPP